MNVETCYNNVVENYYFVGIGGSGMSSIAEVLKSEGKRVSGSDRSYDRGIVTDALKKIGGLGIEIFPQDGTGVTGETGIVVVSTAVEDDNPDVIKAKSLGIKIIKRAELLSAIFNAKYGIGIAGTSGKSTVTGMTSSVFENAGIDSTMIGGGIAKYKTGTDEFAGSARVGKSEIFIVEIDESDGSIIHYRPKIGVLLNISKDHKEIKELKGLFSEFIGNTSEKVIINNDCPVIKTMGLSGEKFFSVGINSGADLRAENINEEFMKTNFRVGSDGYRINLNGIHNVYNALFAVAIAKIRGISAEKISEGLDNFHGIKRRMERIGERNGAQVFDDFGHNPSKIEATLKTMKPNFKRIFAVFQPHGYAPTNFMKEELVDVFSRNLGEKDSLFLLDIYDAGGTAARDISSGDLRALIAEKSGARIFHLTREETADLISKEAGRGDGIVVMGARDPTLTALCVKILDKIGSI